MTDPNDAIDAIDAIRISVQDGAIFIVQVDPELNEEVMILFYPAQVDMLLAALLAAKFQAEVQHSDANRCVVPPRESDSWYCMTCENSAAPLVDAMPGGSADQPMNCILVERNICTPTHAQVMAYRRACDTSLTRAFRQLEAFMKTFAVRPAHRGRCLSGEQPTTPREADTGASL